MIRPDPRRGPRYQRLVQHLHDAGPRPVLEALLEVADGHRLEDVLEHYASIPATVYHAVGASEMEGVHLASIGGSRR